MVQKSLSGVQSLIQKINSCKNPREGRAWLHTLRNKVKEVGYGNLDKDSMESITIIEKSRGDSNRRVSKMKAFNSGFDGISRDYTTLVKGIKSRNLYSASDVAQLFQKQISSSLDNCANDKVDGLTNWYRPQNHFSGLVSQGVIPQETVNKAISKQHLTKLQKGFGYDVSIVQNGIQEGHLDVKDVVIAALSNLEQKTHPSQFIDNYLPFELEDKNNYSGYLSSKIEEKIYKLDNKENLFDIKNL